MEEDVRNCGRCMESGVTVPLKSFYLNLHEQVHCCTNKQCTYNLKNAKLTNKVAIDSETSPTTVTPVYHGRHSLGKVMLQWSNRDNLCWLDAALSVVIMMKSLRECINKVKTTCILKILVVDYEEAMSIYRGDKIVSHDNGLMLDVPGHDIGNRDFNCTFHQDMRSIESCLDLLESKCDDSDKLQKAIDIMNDLRDKVFLELQPKLKCELGSEDSPLFALLALLNQSKPFSEHFLSRYRLELHCIVCGHIQVSCFQKSCICFEDVSVQFDVGHPVVFMKCPKCKAKQQQNHLVYHKLSQCVIMKFTNGLPHNKLDQLQMSVDGHEYKLTAVIQYKQSPKHFVTWFKDVNENLWIEFDDLKPCECKWTDIVPHIPPNQIHVIVLERQNKQCVCCFKQVDYINSLMHSTVSAKTASDKSQELISNASSYQKLTVQNTDSTETLNLLQVAELGPQKDLASLPVQQVPSTKLPVSRNKFLGFQESKQRNVENTECGVKNVNTKIVDDVRPNGKRVTDKVLLDKYLNTCLNGNADLAKVEASSISKPKAMVKNYGNRKRTKQLITDNKRKQNNQITVVMAAIPERLLNTRKVCSRSEAVSVGYASSVGSHVRRRGGQFSLQQKTKFPSYAQNLDLKLFDNFTKNSDYKQVDLTVPSPNPSVASDQSNTSEMSGTSGVLETPSECSLDSSGLDSQGATCHNKNTSLNSTLDDPCMTFDDSAFLDSNQEDFLSSLLETNFTSMPII